MEPNGWKPDSEAVRASEVAQLEASRIEEESLSRLRGASTTPDSDHQTAVEIRKGRPDRRLDVTLGEHQRIERNTDRAVWVIVAVAFGFTLGSTLLLFFINSLI
jgi:hypothetical protein